MNKVILEGRISTELKEINGGVAFNIAVQRNYKNKQTGKREADFINCVAFAGTAELIKNYFTKGDPINLCGKWQTGAYQKQDGTTIYNNTCIVDEVGFVPGATLKRSTPQQYTAPQATATPFASYGSNPLVQF